MLRRVATVAPLALLLIPAGQADAKAKKKFKPPVITSVSPMEVMVGERLTIKGKNFRKGKHRNGIGFKRDGAPVVFVRSDLSTEKLMTVRVPEKLEKVLYGGTPAVFHLRILTRKFGRAFTPDKLSPTIAPRPEAGPVGPTGPSGPTGPNGGGGETPAFDPAGPEGDCDGDKILNKNESGDIDNDLLTDKLEDEIGTDGCKADSDADGAIDSYEYKSAIDLNDDEYQQPQVALPYPGKRPYPNPLSDDDDIDFDGDGLLLQEEHDLWLKLGGRAADETPQTFAAKNLDYSDGLQYSRYERCPSASNPGCGAGDGGRRVPTLRADGYNRHQEFLAWAGANGYATVRLEQAAPAWDHANVRAPFDIRDVNRDGAVTPGCGYEVLYYDFDCDGYLSDDERDEDADGLTNYDESHGRMQPGYWEACYAAEEKFDVPYVGTDLVKADSDGDGVRDGADDQDHDDVPNMMELSRRDASVSFTSNPPRPRGHDDREKGQNCVPDEALEPDEPNHPGDYGKVQPFDPCDPAPWSRTCDRHPIFGTKVDPNWWALQ